VAADSLIRISAGRDISTTTTAAIAASAATTQIEFLAGRNISIRSAVAAGAAGAGIEMLAGLGGSGPGVDSGTVTLAAAVASPNVVIRFNPDGYATTNLAIAQYPALADAKAWVYLQGNNKAYDGTTAATLSLQGNPSDAAEVRLLGGTANFADKNAGLAKAVAYSGYELGGLDSIHFALFPSTGSVRADITPRLLAVTATGANKVYDGGITANVTLADQRISGDQLSLGYTSATFADANVGNSKQIGVSGIRLSGADADNYSVSLVASAAANVTPAALKVSAVDARKTYGQTAALSDFTTTGLVGGETVGSVQVLSAGSAAKAGVANGPYVISASNASGGTFSASNYTISYSNGVLTVLPAGLVITTANDIKLVGTLDTSDAFTAQGLVNGDTIGNFSIYKPGSALEATVAGSPYPIVFSNPKSGSYIASNYQIVYVNGTMTVLPRPVTRLNVSSMWPNAHTTEAAHDMSTLLKVEGVLLPPAGEED
jgi:hypothetical protein